MATIITRVTGATAKGSALTNLEMDQNLINLNEALGTTPVVNQSDIGTNPNQVPLNQMLGSMARQDQNSVNIGGGVANLTEVSGTKVYNNTEITNIQPTLLLDFAKAKKLDSRIAFGRASSALAYDGKTTGKAEENLVLYAQDLTQANWSKTRATITGNAVVAPDGTTTAGKLIEDATASDSHTVSQTVSFAAAYYTFSIFAKAGTRSWIYLNTIEGGNNRTWFDLANGVVGTVAAGSTAAITPVGGGIYRCSVTINARATSSGTVQIGLATGDANITYSGDNASYVSLWGAQLEQRAYATAYTPTTTAAITNYIPALQSYAANVARFDFNPVTGESLGLMVEEQRTNLFTGSQQFGSGGFWGKGNCSAYDNVAVAPDGTLTAGRVVETTNNAIPYVQQSGLGTIGATETLSVYAKAAGRSFIRLVIGNSGANAYFNLSTGAVGTVANGTAIITPVGNGWYRCALSGVRVLNQNNIIYLASADNTSAYTGDGYSGVFLWGAQLEAGAFATSYIPTLLTYSGRGSVGTYIGDNGLIQTAAANAARYQRNIMGAVQLLLESSASNLLNWSNRFTASSIWNSNNVQIALNQIIAPDGTMTGSVMTTIGLSNPHIYATLNTTGNGITYSGSIYLKAGNTSEVNLQWFVNSGSPNTMTHTGAILSGPGTLTGSGTTGLVVTGLSTTQWTRVYATVTPSSATGALCLYIKPRLGASTVIGDTVCLWGVQWETGSVATSYIPSTETFTSRSSTATYYDSGTTALAEQNGFLYSQNLSITANWKSDSTVTPTANAATAPDGTSTATLLTEATTAAGHYVYQTFTKASTVYTVSAYVKANGRTKVNFGYSSDFISANFDLTAVTATTVNASSATITSVGNGWYRCTATRTNVTASGSDAVYIALLDAAGSNSYTGDGTSGIYVWGAQLENRSSASDYVPTTTAAITNYIPRLLTAPSGLARYDFDPVTRLSKGLLVESSSINLLTQSALASGWPLVGATLSSSAAIAPDGTLSAARLIENTVNQQHYINQSQTVTNGATYTLSVYAKAARRNFLWLYGGGLWYAGFDLSNGTVGFQVTPSTNAQITSVGNGWYRCSVTGVATSTSIIAELHAASAANTYSYTGDGWSGLYLWGAQLEAGSVATSYIPTTSAQVTRAADSATSTANSRAADVWSSAQATRSLDLAVMSGSNFSSWYRNSEGTFYTDAMSVATSGQTAYYVASNTSGSDLNFLRLSAGNVIYSGTVQQVSFTNYITSELTRLKSASVYKANDFALYNNGSQINTSSTGQVPIAPTQLGIGNNPIAQNVALNGWIKRLAYFPKRLSNTELQGLTS